MFADVLVLGANFFVRDQYRYYYPTKAIIREIVLDGEFPYWNRYYGGGQPLAANPEYEVFYPPHWLILLPDYDLGFRLHILVHFVIAGVGMFVLGRVMGAGTGPSFITAIAFMLCGPMLSEVNLLPILLAVAWWPWMVAGAIRYLSTGSRAAGAGSAFACGMQALVGEPSSLAMSFLLVGGLALSEGARQGTTRAFGRRTVRVAAILSVGLLIGAAQIVPAADHVGDSVRSEGFSFESVSIWSFPPERAAELLLPRFLGRFWVGSQEIYWGDRFYPEKTFPFLYSIYLGLLAPILFGAAVVKGLPRFRGAALFCLALVPLLIGRNTPLLQLLYDSGVARTLRYPEKIAFLIGFVVLALSAVALERLLRGDREIRRNAVALLVLAMLAAMTAAALAEPGRFARFFELKQMAQAVPGAAAFRIDAMVAALKCVLLAGLVLLSGRNARAGMLALGAFVLIDLAPLSGSVAPRLPREFFTEPPIAAQLRSRLGGARLFPQATHFETPALPRHYLQGHGRVWATRSSMLPMTPGGWGIEMALDDDVDATWLLPTREMLLATWDLRNAGRSDWAAVMMSFSNARYRTLFRDPSAIPPDADPKELAAVAFVEGRPSERFYFADRVVRVRDRAEFVRALLGIEEPWKTAFTDIEPFVPSRGRVLSAEQTHNSVLLDVESEGRGFVIVSITGHRYWRATLDGASLVLRATNLGYQGFEVPAGRHRIAMRYRNPLVLPSVLVSVAAAAAVLACAFTAIRRSRRVGSSEAAAPSTEPPTL